jgi:hypothetical protein
LINANLHQGNFSRSPNVGNCSASRTSIAGIATDGVTTQGLLPGLWRDALDAFLGS